MVDNLKKLFINILHPSFSGLFFPLSFQLFDIAEDILASKRYMVQTEQHKSKYRRLEVFKSDEAIGYDLFLDAFT